MITKAAVKITTLDGEEKVIPCHRHCDAFEICKTFNIQRDRSKDVQGFIKYVSNTDSPDFTGKEEFIDRVQAYIHAVRCGQIKADCEFARELYSEDLW